ncbi:hypothetical protein QLX08_009320 [Tetragonisca angustula]|uniref:Uncharacterized protein n=1 Tax=Tetragonisca angustula TaxID=166442 RepID=A0AAW0ZGW8_9HYME
MSRKILQMSSYVRGQNPLVNLRFNLCSSKKDSIIAERTNVPNFTSSSWFVAGAEEVSRVDSQAVKTNESRRRIEDPDEAGSSHMNFHISAGVRGRRGQILWCNPLKKDEIAEITRLRLPDRNANSPRAAICHSRAANARN